MGESARSIDSHLDGGEPRTFGRYVLYAPIARGGMATIHLARLVGDDGFSRIVAAKRLHPHFTQDPDFVEMFRDEAEIASKIHHPNVVPVLDIVLADPAGPGHVGGEEVVLVQEYVHGVPLDRLFRAACLSPEPLALPIVVALASGMLSGLHAAHETTDETGVPLGIVHRDVSPQNIMVSADGIPRLLDFGIAKARSSSHETRAGLLKGKIAYMAPEQVRGEDVTRAADIYACGVLLWELLALRRMHAGQPEPQILAAVLRGSTPALMEALEPRRATIPKARWELLVRLALVVARATAPLPQERYGSAAEMLEALVRIVPAASASEVSGWVKAHGREYLERRQQLLAETEESWRSQSKIAVAATAGGNPQSGVTRVRGDAAIALEGRLASAAGKPDGQFASAMHTKAGEGPPEIVGNEALGEDAGSVRRAGRQAVRFAPWALAGASLLVSAILVGALAASRHAPMEMPSPASVQEPMREPKDTVVAPATPPVDSSGASSAASTAQATSFLATLPGPVKPSHASSGTPRRVTVEAAPSPAHTVATAAAPTSAPPPKVDCDPPFYFEGTKKVFKPSCI